MKDQYKDWVNIYTSEEIYQADLIKQLLEDNEVPVVSINKHDSAYVMIGHTEIHVPQEFAVKAKAIIAKQKAGES